jgi:hypothetical protein
MKASEVKLKDDGFRFNTRIFQSRSHYKDLMRSGKVLPHTKAQVRYFVSNKVSLGVLNLGDVKVVEDILARNGFSGDYKYTKNKVWVRLQNPEHLIEAFKLEYLK